MKLEKDDLIRGENDPAVRAHERPLHLVRRERFCDIVAALLEADFDVDGLEIGGCVGVGRAWHYIHGCEVADFGEPDPLALASRCADGTWLNGTRVVRSEKKLGIGMYTK